MNQGLQTELKLSREFHLEGVPLLISSSLLRSRNLGQIDLARITRDRMGWLIDIAEVKSSQLGIEQMERSQKRRLLAAQNFLSGVFGHRSQLRTLNPLS
jgi:hypothetical protein